MKGVLCDYSTRSVLCEYAMRSITRVSLTKSVSCERNKENHFSFFTFKLCIWFNWISGTSFLISPICFSAATISLSTVVMSTKLIPFLEKESTM